MKKIFHIFGLVIIFSICLTSFTFSQDAIPSGTARYEALGFNPFIMDAAIDLNRNPAWGNKYNNYAFGDMGRYSGSNAYDTKDSTYQLRDQYLAANFRVGKQWSLGVILNKEEGQIFFGDIRRYYQSIGNDKPIVPFKALIAYNSSANINLGLAPYVAYWSSETTAPNTSIERSTNIWGGTFGILAKSSASSWTEGTVGVRFNTYKADATIDSAESLNLENDGGLELNAFYRGWYKLKNSNVTLVPYVTFDIMNWTPTGNPLTTNTAVSRESDYWNLIGGLGINIPVTDQGMFAGGVSGGYISHSYSLDSSYSDGYSNTILKRKEEGIVFPRFNLGIEWNLTDWLQGRFGYSRSITRDKLILTDTSALEYEYKESVTSPNDQTITLGLGMQFGSFSLDGLIGERFIQIGPNVLSGKENDLYGVVSMSYNFKK